MRAKSICHRENDCDLCSTQIHLFRLCGCRECRSFAWIRLQHGAMQRARTNSNWKINRRMRSFAPYICNYSTSYTNTHTLLQRTLQCRLSLPLLLSRMACSIERICWVLIMYTVRMTNMFPFHVRTHDEQRANEMHCKYPTSFNANARRTCTCSATPCILLLWPPLIIVRRASCQHRAFTINSCVQKMLDMTAISLVSVSFRNHFIRGLKLISENKLFSWHCSFKRKKLHHLCLARGHSIEISIERWQSRKCDSRLRSWRH